MITAFSYFRLGCLMQEFFPHILLNHTVGIHSMFKPPEPPTIYSFRVGVGEPVTIPPLGENQIDPLAPVRNELRAGIRQNVQVLYDECAKLRLIGSFACLARMLSTLDDPEGVWQSL